MDPCVVLHFSRQELDYGCFRLVAQLITVSQQLKFYNPGFPMLSRFRLRAFPLGVHFGCIFRRLSMQRGSTPVTEHTKVWVLIDSCSEPALAAGVLTYRQSGVNMCDWQSLMAPARKRSVGKSSECCYHCSVGSIPWLGGVCLGG